MVPGGGRHDHAVLRLAQPGALPAQGIAAKTKQKYRLEYIGRVQDMQEAVLRYKLLQKRSTTR